MPTEAFKSAIENERKHLLDECEKLQSQIDVLHKQLMHHKRELEALDTYDNASSGRSGANGSARAPRRSRTTTLAALIAGAPTGLTRSQIIDALGIKGNKSQEGSISNALSTMKKDGFITLKDGVYRAA